MPEPMNDNTQAIPVPEGAIVGNGSAQPSQPGGTSTAVPVPEGSIVGSAPPPKSGAQPAQDWQAFGGQHFNSVGEMLEYVGTHAKNTAINFIKGAAGTAHSAASAINHLNPAHDQQDYSSEAQTAITVPGRDTSPSAQTLPAMQHFADTGVGSKADQVVGYGGETLMEFLLGDEALKGLALSEKLLRAGKIAKTIENSPRFVRALKVGAIFNEASLSPAEQQLVKQYPVLTRLVKAGRDAIRAGTVTGAQTAVKTGDFHEGIKEGAKMAGTAFAIGAPLEAGVGMLSKVGKVAEGHAGLVKLAESSADREQVAQNMQTRLNVAEKSMHDAFDVGEKDLASRLQGAEIGAKQAKLRTSAQELLDNPPVEEAGEHELVGAARKAQGDRLDKPVRDMLQLAADGEKPVEEAEGAAAAKTPGIVGPDGKAVASETATNVPKTEPLKPYTVDDILSLRKRVRALADGYPMGDINARTLRKFNRSLDDTFEQLAQQSGDGKALGDYRKLRADYANKFQRFDDPVIRNLQDGKVDDAAKAFVSTKRPGSALPSAGKVRFNMDNLQTLIGDDGVKQFGREVFGTMMKDSVERGQFNASKFLNTWKRITDETKGGLFDVNAANSGLAALAKDAKAAANLQRLSRAGVLGTMGAVGGPYMPVVHVGAGLGSLIGLTAAEGIGGIERGRELLDYIANHPAMWATWRGAGKAAQAAEKVPVVTPARAVAAKRIFDSTSANLGGDKP